MSTSSLICLICRSPEREIAYAGPIRMGSFGKVSNQNAEISRCKNCGAKHLPPIMGNLEDYYRSGEYRADLDQGNSIAKYFELADDEQPSKLELLGMHSLRGKVLADVGAGAGPFLDLAKGICSQTLAVEPNENYHASLKERGHVTHSSTVSAAKDWAGKVDAAVSFSVVEHVEKPREFLQEIKALLKPGGKLLLSTPNADDFVLEISPEYRAFFYRKVHLWYFNGAALKHLAKLAGFEKCDVHYRHRFDLSNALVWLRDKRPSGLGTIPLDPMVNTVWRQNLEATGKSDYLYAILS